MFIEKYIIGFLFILGLIILNFLNLKDFYNDFLGDMAFKSGNYENAIVHYDNIGSFDGNYNLANSYYKSGAFDKALELYDNMNCNDGYDCFKLKNNLANTYYKLSQSQSSYEKISELLSESIDLYRDALKINYDEKTEKNLEYVLDILKKLKKKQEEENQKEDQNKENQSEKQESGDSSSQEDQNSTSENGDNSDKSGEDQNQESSGGTSTNNQTGEQPGDNSNGLSASEQAAINQYEQALKDSQNEFGKYYGKVYDEKSNPIDEFETFFGKGSFFDNSSLDGGNDKKDW